MTKTLSLLAACLASVSVSATVLFNIDAELLKDQNGDPITSGLIILGASTTGSDFALPTADAFFSGDDIEIHRWDFVLDPDPDFGGPGSFSSTTGTKTFSGTWNAGDPLQLYWFPSLSSVATEPGFATPFGTYRHDTGLDGSDPWVTPADGTPLTTLKFFTDDATPAGSNPASAGIASQMTPVPEPSQYAAAFGLACLAWAAYSRRKKQAAA